MSNLATTSLENSIKIELGNEEDLTILYSYPNSPEINESLAETVQYWLQQTLQRDGFDKDRVSLHVESGEPYILTLQADSSLHEQLKKYQDILDQFSAMGLKMYKEHMLKIMQDELWDPNNKGWRFMLPLGLPLMNKRAIQFFHFPTLRLLTNQRDSLNDPVPKRVEDLTVVNGASEQEIEQYMMMANSIPVAGPDDEGKLVDIMVDKFRDDFVQYDRELVEMLLNASDNEAKATIPIVVYGTTTRQMFNDVFNVNLSETSRTDVASIIENKTTPVMAMHHPFSFFYRVQKKPEAGSDITYPGTGEYQLNDPTQQGYDQAYAHHQNDMIGAAWLQRMVEDNNADPAQVYALVSDYWKHPDQQVVLRQWLFYHASMWVENGTTGTWKFVLPKNCLQGLKNFLSDASAFASGG